MSGEKVVKVRSDGAPESRKVVDIIGAVHELSTAKTPKQNDKA